MLKGTTWRVGDMVECEQNERTRVPWQALDCRKASLHGMAHWVPVMHADAHPAARMMAGGVWTRRGGAVSVREQARPLLAPDALGPRPPLGSGRRRPCPCVTRAVCVAAGAPL